MRYILTFVSLVIFTTGCTTTSKNYNDFESAEKLFASSKEKPEHKAYVSEFIDSQNQQWLDDDSGCYEFDKGTKVELILTVNKAGVISSSATSTETKKATCFRKAYIGAKMPRPPFSPLAIKLTMN